MLCELNKQASIVKEDLVNTGKITALRELGMLGGGLGGGLVGAGLGAALSGGDMDSNAFMIPTVLGMGAGGLVGAGYGTHRGLGWSGLPSGAGPTIGTLGAGMLGGAIGRSLGSEAVGPWTGAGLGVGTGVLGHLLAANLLRRMKQ